MKEAVKFREQAVGTSRSDTALAVAKHIFSALFGFLAAKGTLLSALLPFGVSVAGGVTVLFSPAAAVGAALGYISGGAAFRYIAGAFSIAAIKILLCSSFKGEIKPIFSALAVALVAGSTAIVTVKQEELTIVMAAAETLIAASGTYFISVTSLSLERGHGRFTASQLGAVLISVACIFTGLFSVSFSDISLGSTLSVALILFVARYGGAGLGSVCGVALGFSAVLSGYDSSILLFLGFGGMLAGAFSLLNRYAVILSFMLSSFVSVALIDSVGAIIFIVEAALGSVIFILIPKNLGARVGAYLNPISAASREGPKRAVKMRLDLAADALKDVSNTVEQIATELSRINAPDFSRVLVAIENDACRGCALRTHCWETKKADTLSAVIEMTKAVKNRERTPEIFAPEEFRGRCQRPAAVGKAVNSRYSDYAARISAENRIDEVRSVVSDQFDGISEMLKDLSASLEREQVYDNNAAGAVANQLKSADLRVLDVTCKIDEEGRMRVEARVKQSDTPINRMHIMTAVSACCDRDFDKPHIETVGDTSVITLCERTVLSADIGVNQITCTGKNICGDAYNYFLDGRGKLVLTLADGMGTGGRAAVDSAMASGLIGRLLRAGFGYDTSLKILNSSMLFKSTDESLSTVDIAVIDLHSGKTDLLKAGAAPTIVRRAGRAGRAESKSLPVGILRDIGFDKATIRLKKGDILLMVTDGAIGDNYDWICEEVGRWGDGTAQQLAEHVSQIARRRREGYHEDDITVLAVIMGRAY